MKKDFKTHAPAIIKRYLRAVAFNWGANSCFWILLKLFTSGGGSLDGKFKVLLSILVSVLAVFFEDI